jgi:hypothetical protein
MNIVKVNMLEALLTEAVYICAGILMISLARLSIITVLYS